MKKAKSNKKLLLNKRIISNLHIVKGGKGNDTVMVSRLRAGDKLGE